MTHDFKTRIDDLKARTAFIKERWDGGEIDEDGARAELLAIAEERAEILRDYQGTTAATPGTAPIPGGRLVVAVKAFCDAYLAFGRT